MIIQKIIKRLLSKIQSIDRYYRSKTEYLINVFGTSQDKNVLISYITSPFYEGLSFNHSNYYECFFAAEIFKDLGYNVDVINFNSDLQIDYSKYNIVYGNGNALENAFYVDDASKIIKILYSPGTNLIYFYQTVGLLAFKKFRKHKVLMPSSLRMNTGFWPMQFTCADGVISLGNKFSANTFLSINPEFRLRSLPAFYFDTYQIDLSKKIFSQARNHFLWFGSGGAQLKGLDILIELFSKTPQLTLHICGANKTEKTFFDFYNETLNASTNIINHDFIDIKSDDFKKLMNDCAFVVFPSASEGGAVSSLNVMANGGLIPILSRSTGLDIEEFGYIVDEISEENFSKVIDIAIKESDIELENRAVLTYRRVREIYTIENYKSNLTNSIKTLIASA